MLFDSPNAIPGHAPALFINGPYNKKVMEVTTVNGDFPMAYSFPQFTVSARLLTARYEYSKEASQDPAKVLANTFGPLNPIIEHIRKGMPVYVYAS